MDNLEQQIFNDHMEEMSRQKLRDNKKQFDSKKKILNILCRTGKRMKLIYLPEQKLYINKLNIRFIDKIEIFRGLRTFVDYSKYISQANPLNNEIFKRQIMSYQNCLKQDAEQHYQLTVHKENEENHNNLLDELKEEQSPANKNQKGISISPQIHMNKYIKAKSLLNYVESINKPKQLEIPQQLQFKKECVKQSSEFLDFYSDIENNHDNYNKKIFLEQFQRSQESERYENQLIDQQRLLDLARQLGVDARDPDLFTKTNQIHEIYKQKSHNIIVNAMQRSVQSFKKIPRFQPTKERSVKMSRQFETRLKQIQNHNFKTSPLLDKYGPRKTDIKLFKIAPTANLHKSPSIILMGYKDPLVQDEISQIKSMESLENTEENKDQVLSKLKKIHKQVDQLSKIQHKQLFSECNQIQQNFETLHEKFNFYPKIKSLNFEAVDVLQDAHFRDKQHKKKQNMKIFKNFD